MPIYEYRCTKCAQTFEVVLSSTESPHPACPVCGADKAERIMSGFAVKIHNPSPCGSNKSCADSCPSSAGRCPFGGYK